jgi:hypothetical protein
MAKVLRDAKETKMAIEYQVKAVNCYQSLDKYTETDFLAELHLTLSDLHDREGRTEEALNSLRIVEAIYKTNYSEIHAKTCKVKRNISLLYLKSDQNEAALREL